MIVDMENSLIDRLHFHNLNGLLSMVPNANSKTIILTGLNKKQRMDQTIAGLKLVFGNNHLTLSGRYFFKNIFVFH